MNVKEPIDSNGNSDSGTIVAKSYGARWIIPVDQPPLQDASITIADGVILSVNKNGRMDADIDLGNVALTPMLVNAHTHLEFSSLDSPLGNAGNSITDWIPEVIGWRLKQTAEQTQLAIESGLHESLAWGVDCLGEIATSPWLRESSVLNGDVHINWFAERLGSDPELAETKIEEVQTWLGKLRNDKQTSGIQMGVSPHAPYSICPELFEGLVKWANAESMPMAMHLAESQEEIEWLRSGKGPFKEMLDQLGVASSARIFEQPMGFLQSLATVDRALVVHGNYLSEKELEYLGGQENLHLVYCPRTHDFFGHQPYPLESAIDFGIDLAVGTDSLASNPDLSVLAELKHIHKTFPRLAPETVLRMGTINGAKALNFHRSLGTLSPGKQGEFLTFELHSGDDPWESILS